MKKLSILLTAGVLAALYAHIDLSRLGSHLLRVHPLYFGFALMLFIPLFWVTSLRWRLMILHLHPLTMRDSFRMVMASKALNAVLPSKLGEMSKAFFLRREGGPHLGPALFAVILEKALDLGGLCSVMLLGFLLSPQRTHAMWVGAAVSLGVILGLALLMTAPLERMAEWMESRNRRFTWLTRRFREGSVVIHGWKRRRGGVFSILFLSFFLWCLHILQIYLFFPSLRQPMSVHVAMANIPLGLLVGLLPITLGGMGTRDAALIVLFRDYADPSLMAGIGILCSLRIWVDSLLGVPFLHRSMKGDTEPTTEAVDP
jgi:hypothetical protein